MLVLVKQILYYLPSLLVLWRGYISLIVYKFNTLFFQNKKAYGYDLLKLLLIGVKICLLSLKLILI